MVLILAAVIQNLMLQNTAGLDSLIEEYRSLPSAHSHAHVLYYVLRYIARSSFDCHLSCGHGVNTSLCDTEPTNVTEYSWFC